MHKNTQISYYHQEVSCDSENNNDKDSPAPLSTKSFLISLQSSELLDISPPLSPSPVLNDAQEDDEVIKSTPDADYNELEEVERRVSEQEDNYNLSTFPDNARSPSDSNVLTRLPVDVLGGFNEAKKPFGILGFLEPVGALRLAMTCNDLRTHIYKSYFHKERLPQKYKILYCPKLFPGTDIEHFLTDAHSNWTHPDIFAEQWAETFPGEEIDTTLTYEENGFIRTKQAPLNRYLMETFPDAIVVRDMGLDSTGKNRFYYWNIYVYGHPHGPKRKWKVRNTEQEQTFLISRKAMRVVDALPAPQSPPGDDILYLGEDGQYLEKYPKLRPITYGIPQVPPVTALPNPPSPIDDSVYSGEDRPKKLEIGNFNFPRRSHSPPPNPHPPVDRPDFLSPTQETREKVEVAEEDGDKTQDWTPPPSTITLPPTTITTSTSITSIALLPHAPQPSEALHPLGWMTKKKRKATMMSGPFIVQVSPEKPGPRAPEDRSDLRMRRGFFKYGSKFAPTELEDDPIESTSQ